MNSFIIKRSLTALASVKCGPATASVCSVGSSSKNVDKCVLISQSTNIHRNLALEDWLYRNGDFSHQQILLLWRNDPAVVIGRHQNIWQEVDVHQAQKNRVRLARRNSGGGTVYHDKGNLNLTFFTTRKSYCREKNLTLVSKALDRGYGIKTQISPKHDLTFSRNQNDVRKVTADGSTFVSGTASKLGNNAYHHLTLLLDVDLKALGSLLNPEHMVELDTNATKSIPSPVINLKAVEPKIDVDNALEAIGYEFLRTDENGGDGGQDLIQKQRGFQMINPSDEWFPGIDTVCTELKGWKWNFAKSPDFKVRKTYTEPEYPSNLQLELFVSKGVVESVKLEPLIGSRSDLDDNTKTDIEMFTNAVHGKPYSHSVVNNLEGLLLSRSVRAFDSVDPILFEQSEEDIVLCSGDQATQLKQQADAVNRLSRQTMFSL